MTRRVRVARRSMERVLEALAAIDEDANEWADLARVWLAVDAPDMVVASDLMVMARRGVMEGPIGSNKVIGTAPCLARFAVSALACHASLPADYLEPALREEARWAAEDLARYLDALASCR